MLVLSIKSLWVRPHRADGRARQAAQTVVAPGGHHPAALPIVSLRMHPHQMEQHMQWKWHIWMTRKQQASRPCRTAAAAAIMAAPAASSAAQGASSHFWTALVQAWSTNPAAVMLATAACLLGTALTVFLCAAIPTLLAFRRAAHAAELLLHALHTEVPDTAAAVRLSTMDVADCIEEVTALGNDLAEGVRAGARAVGSAEQGVRQGADLAGRAVTEYMVPQIKRKGQEARDVLESALKERAHLRHTKPAVQEITSATKSAAQRLRAALAAARLASKAAATVSSVRSAQQW